MNMSLSNESIQDLCVQCRELLDDTWCLVIEPDIGGKKREIKRNDNKKVTHCNYFDKHILPIFPLILKKGITKKKGEVVYQDDIDWCSSSIYQVMGANEDKRKMSKLEK